MMSATTPQMIDLAGDAIADIRAAMGVLYVLAADGAVDAACMTAAINRVEGDLAVLEAATAPPPGGDGNSVELPVKTLADIAKEAAVMPSGQTLRAPLVSIQGGRA